MESIMKHAEPFFLKGNDHAVLLVHGFTGSPSHMRLVGEALHESGFTVYGLRLKGHGTTIEDMMKASWKDWVMDVEKALSQLFSEYKYVSIAGLSMGGVLSLIMAEAYANNTKHQLTSCTAIEAPMGTTNPFRHFALPYSLFVPIMHKRADGARDTLNKTYDMGYNEIPTRKTHDLNVLMACAKRDLPFIHCPTLIVQSKNDHTVSKNSSDIIFSNIKSLTKKQVWLHDAPHVSTISNEYMTIVTEMIAFLKHAQTL